MQHLDYCYNIGLFEKFAGVTGLRQTIRGRKRLPAIDFSVGKVGPIHVKAGRASRSRFRLRGTGRHRVDRSKKLASHRTSSFGSCFYPYRKWRIEIPAKQIHPWFFCSEEVAAGRRLYKFWNTSLQMTPSTNRCGSRGAKISFVEPARQRLTVEELLRAHVRRRAEARLWDVPQADTFERVAEMPLLVEQGIDTSAKVRSITSLTRARAGYISAAASEYSWVGVARTNASHVYHAYRLGP